MNDRNQVQTALEQVREVLRGDEASGGGTTFMRGLTLGALLGAAIAGSAPTTSLRPWPDSLSVGIWPRKRPKAAVSGA